MRFLIAAGEVSADRIGAGVARALRARTPSVGLIGLGGTAMAGEHVRLLDDTAMLGAVGISEAVRVAPALIRAFTRLRRAVEADPPDAALLIGNDLFHVGVARWLRRRGVPTAVLFPPPFSIWRPVAGWIARSYDVLFASFAEEARDYERAGGAVRFVGHYLADEITLPLAEDRARVRHALGLDEALPVLAVLPGSRRSEISLLLPRMRQAIALLERAQGPVQVVLPVSAPGFRPLFESLIGTPSSPRITLLAARGREALLAADVALCASGTATLEAALLGTPMVVAYRVSRTTDAVVRMALRTGLLESDAIALPNLVLGEQVVPELKQHACTAAAMAAHAGALLVDATTQARRLADVRTALRADGALATVASSMFALAAGQHVALPAPSRERPA